MILSRREFLEDSVFAVAAAALTAGGAQLAKAAPEEARPRVGPNEKIRVAVIGCNGQGGGHIHEWLRNPDVELVAICDCDSASYKKQSKQFADLKTPPRYVQDVRKLLEDKNIDAVSIAAPNHWHALMAIWAMQNGKDVYVEKPCSHTVQEGRVMVNWARKLGKICQMGTQSRSMTGMRETLDFIKSGKIGKVTFARALCYKARPSIGHVQKEAPIPAGLDFDLWCGPAPLVVPKRSRLHYDWHWNWLTGNGDIGNQNPHELDKARWGIGKQELPKRVISLGGRLGYVDDGETANSQVTFYDYGDAMIVSDVRGLPVKSDVTFGLNTKGFRSASNVWYGTEGYVVSHNYQSGAAFDYSGKPMGKWSGGAYQAHFANFIKGVKSRNYKDLHVDIEDGHYSSALAHLGNASLRAGQPVPGGTRPSEFTDDKHVRETLETFEQHLKENGVNFDVTKLYLGALLNIDPKTELSDKAEANKYFKREYRKGYELPLV